MSFSGAFPSTFVKIDQSFIHDLGHSSADDAVVSAVIALSHSLGKTVVAEGVETTDQLETFTSLKGDLVQGYYYSPPVPADEFPALLKHPIGV